MEQNIYRVVTVEGFNVTHVEKTFCSTKEKAVEMIEKDAQRYASCGSDVQDYKYHKWKSVAIKEGCQGDGWVTATLVKSIVGENGGEKALGYVTYAMI